MDIGKVITLEDNKDYLLLEKVSLNSKDYIYIVEVDKNDLPTTNYLFLELTHEPDGDYTEEVEDKNIIEALTSLLTVKYINDSMIENDEQAA